MSFRIRDHVFRISFLTRTVGYITTNTSLPNESNSVYDASDQRVAAQVNGVWTFFVYEIGGNIFAKTSF